jgi:hypothetical protein
MLDFDRTLDYRGDEMGAIFDAARSLINRIEALLEEFALSRDSDFAESLREADEDLRMGRTTSLAGLDTEDRPVAF